MTITIENTRKSQATKLGFHPFELLVRAIGEAAVAATSSLAGWRAARALGRLGDAELKDIGVSRGNIERAVRSGRK